MAEHEPTGGEAARPAPLLPPDPLGELPVITGAHTDESLTQDLFRYTWSRPGRACRSGSATCCAIRRPAAGC